jgi:ribonuclease HI
VQTSLCSVYTSPELIFILIAFEVCLSLIILGKVLLVLNLNFSASGSLHIHTQNIFQQVGHYTYTHKIFFSKWITTHTHTKHFSASGSLHIHTQNIFQQVDHYTYTHKTFFSKWVTTHTHTKYFSASGSLHIHTKHFSASGSLHTHTHTHNILQEAQIFKFIDNNHTASF